MWTTKPQILGGPLMKKDPKAPVPVNFQRGKGKLSIPLGNHQATKPPWAGKSKKKKKKK